MSEATGPAATKVQATTDVFVWILAAVPLIASIVAAFLDQNVDVDPNALVAAAIILQMVSCAVLADMDAMRLMRAGRTQDGMIARISARTQFADRREHAIVLVPWGAGYVASDRDLPA